MTVQRAVRALAKLSGGGFVGHDLRFGKALAAIPHDDWKPDHVSCAYRMLAPYADALANLGIVYSYLRPDGSSVEPQVEPEESSAYRVRYDHDRSKWTLEFPYDLELIRALHAIGLEALRGSDGRFAWPIPGDKLHTAMPILEKARFSGLKPIKRMFAERRQNAEESRAKVATRRIVLPGGELKPFQVAGVDYIRRVKRVLLGDQPGLGKSIQTLTAIEELDAYPALVVPPASLKQNWKNEYEKFLGNRRAVEVLEGLQAIPSGDAHVYVANYDLLHVEHDTRPCPRCARKKGALAPDPNCPACEGTGRVEWKGHWKLVGLAERLKAMALKSIAFDEFHACKNPKTRRSRACLRLAEGVPVRIGLTGTPFLSRPIEGASQLEILGWLDEFGGYNAYARKYAGAVMGQWGLDTKGSANLEDLNERMRGACYVRRTKDEVLPELPPKQKQTVILPLSNRAEYRRAEKDFLEWVEKNKGADAADRASRAEELARIGVLRTVAARGKLRAAKEWVANFLESGDRLVIFAHHVEIQSALAEEFKAPQIQGEASAKQTEAAQKRFFDGENPLLVCSLLAGGVGHNLHCDGKCSSVALLELPWNPGHVEQAIDRVHRIGQTASRVNVYFLVAEETIDQDMIDLILEKQKVVDAATDGRQREAILGSSIADDLVSRLRSRSKRGQKNLLDDE